MSSYKHKLKRFTLLVVSLGFAMRLLCQFLFDFSDFPDALYYQKLGQILCSSGELQSTKVMPIYPIISFLSFKLYDLHLIDILLSSASIYLVVLLCDEIFGNFKISIIGGLLFAFYPFSVYYSFSGLTETSYTFCVLLTFLLLYRKKYNWSFIVMCMTLLIRPTNDYLNPILIISFMMLVHREGTYKIISSLAKYFFIYILILTPWWISNYQKYDHFVRLNLGFGEMLYGGNNPNNLEGRAIEDALILSKSISIKDPYIRDKALVKEGIDYIFSEKKQFVITSLKRFKYFINPFPNHPSFRSTKLMLISFVSISVLYLGTLMMIFSIERRLLFKVIPLFIFIAYITLVHTLTISSIRYRYPIEPLLLIFTAYSIFLLVPKRLKPPILG